MAIDLSFLPSVISAASGLGGVWLGGWLTTRREAERERERSEKESKYLGILVLAHLDRFARQCLEVSYDNGTIQGQPASDDGIYHQFTVMEPRFEPLELKVDWKVLPADLMYHILNLPYKTEQLIDQVYGVREHDEPPEYTETFWTRQQGFAELGLEVSALARQLRQQLRLPAEPPTFGGPSREDRLRAQRDKIAKARGDWERRVAANKSHEVTPTPDSIGP